MEGRADRGKEEDMEGVGVRVFIGVRVAGVDLVLRVEEGISVHQEGVVGVVEVTLVLQEEEEVEMQVRTIPRSHLSLVGSLQIMLDIPDLPLLFRPSRSLRPLRTLGDILHRKVRVKVTLNNKEVNNPQGCIPAHIPTLPINNNNNNNNKVIRRQAHLGPPPHLLNPSNLHPSSPPNLPNLNRKPNLVLRRSFRLERNGRPHRGVCSPHLYLAHLLRWVGRVDLSLHGPTRLLRVDNPLPVQGEEEEELQRQHHHQRLMR